MQWNCSHIFFCFRGFIDFFGFVEQNICKCIYSWTRPRFWNVSSRAGPSVSTGCHKVVIGHQLQCDPNGACVCLCNMSELIRAWRRCSAAPWWITVIHRAWSERRHHRMLRTSTSALITITGNCWAKIKSALILMRCRLVGKNPP